MLYKFPSFPKFVNSIQYLGTVLLHNFVPKHSPVRKEDLELLKKFIYNSQKILVLTGAGISTESGIPDYRSEEVGLYARSNHKPTQYKEYLKSEAVRQRYWARNYIGWDRFSKCEPNSIHHSIRNLEIDHNKVSAVVTQNVDALHYKAGSKNVVELHGTAYSVVCLNCSKRYDRHEIQEWLSELNPSMKETSTMIRPDGDVEVSQDKIQGFKPPLCRSCGGILKPDIIFYGDNVPRARVTQVQSFVSESDSVLVLGSSLTVFSCYRIILQAVEEHKNIALVNIGPTRADKHAHLKLAAKCGDVLPKIC